MTVMSQDTSIVGPLRLRLQLLPGPKQVLAMGSLVALNNAGVFTTRQVADLYIDLRLPSPANLSSTLGRLRDQQLLMRPSANVWALTPTGEQKLNDELPTLASALGPHPLDVGSDFGQRRHSLLPPLLSPMGSHDAINRLLKTTDFETNVMLITRFPKSSDDPFTELVKRLRTTVAGHGLNLLIASDSQADDTLWANVVTYMWACKYAIVLMDTPDGVLNSNVLIEVGGMLMTGRRCAIVRDVSVPQMPTDLVGHVYKPADLSDHEATAEVIHRWIRDDLLISSCAACPKAA